MASPAAVSGDVRLTFTAAPHTLAVRTISGDSTVHLPRGSGPYRLDLQTTSGAQRVTVEHSATATRSVTVQATSGDMTIGYA